MRGNQRNEICTEVILATSEKVSW